MTLRLSRGEFWLLGRAVETKYPLAVLLLPEFADCSKADRLDHRYIEEVFNCSGHGLDRKALRATLGRMARLGWIEFESSAHRLPPDQRHVPMPPDRPANVQLELARTQWSEHVYYGLTALGGQVWETFARPDWKYFMDHSWGDCDPLPADQIEQFRQRFGDAQTVDRDDLPIKSHEVTAATPELLERWLAQAQREFHCLRIAPMATLKPWQATYWKTLETGFQQCLLMRNRGLLMESRLWRFSSAWCDWQ